MSPWRPGTSKNNDFHLTVVISRGIAFFVLGFPGDHFGEVLGLILEPLGIILGHFGGQDGSKSRPSDPTWGVQFRLDIWGAIFWLTAPVPQATVVELDGPVQLFSWRKLEELEVISYAMHHGMMWRIQQAVGQLRHRA